MTDDPLDPAHLLASAALDDEVTAEERAQVEASPSLIDERDYYRGLRGRMSEVDVPAGAREGAIAAAMATFDELQVPLAEAGESTEPIGATKLVAIDERRRRSLRWLGAAAAVVAVLAIAGVVSRQSHDDNKSASQVVSNVETSAASSKTPPFSAAGAATAESTASAEAATAPAPAPESADAQLPVISAIGGAAAVSPWLSAPALSTSADVAAFANTLPSIASESSTAATTAASEASARPAPSTTAIESTVAVDPQLREHLAACDLDPSRPSAFVIYAGRDVIVSRDDSTRRVIVVDDVSCATVETIALP